MRNKLITGALTVMLFTVFLFPVFANIGDRMWGVFYRVEDLEGELWMHWWLAEHITSPEKIQLIDLFYHPGGAKFFNIYFLNFSVAAVLLKIIFPFPFYYNLFLVAVAASNYFSMSALLRHLTKNSLIHLFQFPFHRTARGKALFDNGIHRSLNLPLFAETH